MTVSIFNRLIVSPGKQHRQITHFMSNELAIHPIECYKKKEHLRFDFMTQDRAAFLEIKTLSNAFPSYNFDLIWHEEPCTYVKALRVMESNFYSTSYIRWGLSDYFNEDTHPEQENSLLNYDWTALEYDLLKASYHGGFLENSKIIPDLQHVEALDILASNQFAPDSLSAQALVMHCLSGGIPVQDLPTDYLSPELYITGFQQQFIPFERLPDTVLSEEFLEDACFREGKDIFIKINPKQLSEDICLAAITAIKAPISLKDIPNSLRTQIICEFALQQDIDQFRFVPKKLLSQDFCNQYPGALRFIPGDFKTLELCKSALRSSESNLAFVPRHFITKSLLNKIIRESIQPAAFLEFVPPELVTARLVNFFIKKNPREFKFIPEDFKSYETTKRYVIRDIENLAFASHESLDGLLKHRTIKKQFMKHEDSLGLLPKSYLTKEIVFEIFKSKGVSLDEVPNHLISEPLMLLAIRRIKKSSLETNSNTLQYDAIAHNCSKPKVWQLVPNKLKDYEFCKLAIIVAHPSVEANILLHLIDNTPREIDAFNDSIQWLYYFIENRLSFSFRDEHLFQIDLSDYLDKVLDGSARGEDELNIFVEFLRQDIVQTPKQLQAIQEIGSAAWRLWMELCSKMYPNFEDTQQTGSTRFQATRFLHSSNQMKILNLYLKIADEVNISQPVEEQIPSNT